MRRQDLVVRYDSIFILRINGGRTVCSLYKESRRRRNRQATRSQADYGSESANRGNIDGHLRLQTLS